VQRKGKQSGGNDLKSVMGEQYGVDLSGYKEHKDSSFPSTVGASATIQGKDIHYAPGQFTEQNRKHELGHAIDNTLNGTPKGDKTIQGHSIDTTREAAADKIMNTPLQRKVDGSQGELAQPNFSSGGAIQRIQWSDREEVVAALRDRYRKLRDYEVSDAEFQAIVRAYAKKKQLGIDEVTMQEILPEVKQHIIKRQGRRHSVQERSAAKGIRRAQQQLLSDQQGNLQSGVSESGALSAMAISEREKLDDDQLTTMMEDETDSIISGAHGAKEEFDDTLEAAISTLPGHKPRFLKGPLKAKHGIVNKARKKYEHDTRRLTDVVRSTLVFQNMEDLVASAERLSTSTFQIVRIKNGLGKKPGYQDMKLNIRLPKSGYIAELQLQVEALNKAKDKEGGHEVYEVERLDMEKDGPIVFKDKVDEKGQVIETKESRATKWANKLDVTIGILKQKGLPKATLEEYERVLGDLQKQAKEKQVVARRDDKDIATLQEIGVLIYQNVNEEVKDALDKPGAVKNGMAKVEQQAGVIDASMKRRGAAKIGQGGKGAKPKGKPVRQQDLTMGARVTGHSGGEVMNFRVRNVSGQDLNCLIYAIARALGRAVSPREANKIRDKIGAREGTYLANDAQVVGVICDHFGVELTIRWWELRGGRLRIAGGGAYGDTGAMFAREVNIVLTGGNHFQFLERQFADAED
jgi:hypothetical protein